MSISHWVVINGERVDTATADDALRMAGAPESSPSVSVSVSSPVARASKLAGLALRLNVRTVASSSVGKRTFLEMGSGYGVEGAEHARK